MKKDVKSADQTDWIRIDQLFQEAVDAEPVARASLLSLLSGHDVSVLNEVRRLLELHDRAGTFLENPHATNPGPQRGSMETGCQELYEDHLLQRRDLVSVNDVLGRFRLLQRLDGGGMGDVWLAERADGQFQQSVAIKVFRTTNACSEGVERFLQERQTLARLEHPSIARLIDGGTTADGTPYLVMERVDGIPIDQYCTKNELTRNQRIELFQLVCEAVHFAHQSLVIHRDLKPANILVTPSGRPKLLDFGIAQWLGESWEVRTSEALDHRQVLCTLDFASPEQIGGGTCTTASDVYSLGVILRRICSGGSLERHVGPITKLAGCSAFLHAEIPPVGKDLSEFTPSPGDAAHADDLDWIIRKAMQRDPALRYATAKELDTDLGRLLSGYPVDARSPTTAYRTLRFIQRNTLLTIAGLLLAVILMSATIATGLAWQRASVERDAAQAATRFIGGILTSTSPFASRRNSGESVNAEVLAMTSQQAAAQLKELPAVEIQVRVMLAHAYASLWQWQQVHNEATHALRLLATTLFRNPEIESRSLTLLGRAQTWLRDERAVATQRRALELRRQLFGEVHMDVAEAQIALGFALWRMGTLEQQSEADRKYREGISIYRRSGIACSADFARALFSYSEFRRSRKQYDAETFEYVREAAQCYKKLTDPPDRYRIAAQSSYSGHLLAKGEAAKALAELTSLGQLIPAELDAEEQTRHMYWTKGKLEILRGDQADAFQSFRRALRGECLAHVAPGPYTRQLRIVAQMFRAAERIEDLLAAIKDLVPILNDSSIPWDSDLRVNVAMATGLAFETARIDEARSIVDELLDAQERHVPRDAMRIALLRSVLAGADFHKGDYETALREWTQSFHYLGEIARYDDLMFQSTILGIVRANEALDKPKAASQFRALLFRWD